MTLVRSEQSKMVKNYCIVGNFWGGKPSWISWFYSHPRRLSAWNFRHATPIYVNIPRKFSPWNSPSCRFSPSKISHYTVMWLLWLGWFGHTHLYIIQYLSIITQVGSSPLSLYTLDNLYLIQGLLDLEGSLASVLVHLVKRDQAATNMLDSFTDAQVAMNSVKERLHEMMRSEEDFNEDSYSEVLLSYWHTCMYMYPIL